MSPRRPVLWITVAAFVIVATATQDWFCGALVLFIFLPIVLIGQWCIRFVCRRFHSPVWLRRTVMLLPALILALALFCKTNVFSHRTALLRRTLAGQIPAGIRELHVDEEGWFGYGLFIYIRCDPGSLRGILEQPSFARMEIENPRFSFADSPISDLHGRPNPRGVILFRRTDLGQKGACEVYTDANFSFAYVVYMID